MLLRTRSRALDSTTAARRAGAPQRAVSRMRLLAAAVLLASTSACANDPDKEPVLQPIVRSDLPPGVRVPVGTGDLAAVQARGQLVFDLERAVQLAYGPGLDRVGRPAGVVLLPLPDVDPGRASGQVVFARWRGEAAANPAALAAATADRWVLLSLKLAPDGIYGVEPLSGSLVEDTLEPLRVDAIIAAAKAVGERAAGVEFHFLPVAEQVASKNKRTGGVETQIRVYALATAADGPDFEVVVGPAQRRGDPPALRSIAQVHAAGAVSPGSIACDDLQPGPLTVARAMLQPGPEVAVRTTDGASWRVRTSTGELLRDDGAAAPAAAPAPSPGARPDLGTAAPAADPASSAPPARAVDRR